VTATYCDHCGDPLTGGDHRRCRLAREMEPPRYCPDCRRRMVVQVTPGGWTADCARHGTRTAG
jgi:RNase P subunit RPR2